MRSKYARPPGIVSIYWRVKKTDITPQTPRSDLFISVRWPISLLEVLADRI